MGLSDRHKRILKNIKLFFWFIGFVAIIGGIFFLIGKNIVDVDPFFHYHKPDTDKYFYILDSERNMNDGILRNFDFDALIIGTSMAQNFKTSEFDEIFGVNSVKTTFSGGSFRETGDRLKRALKSNDDISLVVRSLDMDFFFLDYDDLGDMASGDYPDYLYDDSILNDYKYVLNLDVYFNRVRPMINEIDNDNFESGITSFDTYSNWMPSFIGSFGSGHVIEKELKNYTPSYRSLNDSEKLKIRRNITYNILDIAEEYPDVDFYYFITPYSGVWWNSQNANGILLRQIQAEQYIIEMMLDYDNIHLYSFNTNFDLTLDLNNYKDMGHYGEWVNSAMLIWMKDGTGLLTKDNYIDYIKEEYDYYLNYNYTLLNDQEDYENDYDAATALLGEYY